MVGTVIGARVSLSRYRLGSYSVVLYVFGRWHLSKFLLSYHKHD